MSRAGRGFVALLTLLGALESGAQAPGYSVTMKRVGDEVVLEVGPVDLPRGSSSPAVAGTPATKVVIPVDGWFRGYRIEIVDRHGAAVPTDQVVVTVLSLTERELFSPIALRVAAIAPGSPSVTLPRVLGYRAVRGDTLLVSAQFRRAAGRSWEGVRARIRFPFVPKSAFVGALRIQPFSMEVLPPGGAHEYDLPVGTSERYWETKPAVGGRVLGFGGFVKPYAVMLRLEDRTAGRLLWEYRPDTVDRAAVKEVPVARFLRSVGLALQSDHVYRLTARYDNRTGAVIRDGGAGTIGGVYLVGRGERWPRVNHADSTFLRDLRGFLR